MPPRKRWSSTACYAIDALAGRIGVAGEKAILKRSRKGGLFGEMVSLQLGCQAAASLPTMIWLTGNCAAQRLTLELGPVPRGKTAIPGPDGDARVLRPLEQLVEHFGLEAIAWGDWMQLPAAALRLELILEARAMVARLREYSILEERGMKILVGERDEPHGDVARWTRTVRAEARAYLRDPAARAAFAALCYVSAEKRRWFIGL